MGERQGLTEARAHPVCCRCGERVAGTLYLASGGRPGEDRILCRGCFHAWKERRPRREGRE